ncbi:hypothetical protein [Bacillus sp. es.034]|uniref:hypothetical protein n=1 Tax=Bacillus sp. es.034 TaxID=1761763 RepID=UPI000BF3AE01|nr:hypothetical protein [Bacillus sp. es.034]PFG07781.1 hypothetical protein ATG71_4690 [Bacillus sp. es.034]
MNLDKILKEYTKKYSLISLIKDNIQRNRWLILYLLLIVMSGVGIFISYFFMNLKFIIISLVGFATITIVSYKHQEKVRDHDPSVERDRLKEFRKFLRNQKFSSKDQLESLDAYVTKEIEYLSNSPAAYNHPYIRSLVVALFTSGLLSYSFKLLSDGNTEQAKLLLMLYLLIIGILMILISSVYMFRESFSRLSKLKGLSLILSRILVEIALQQPAEGSKKKK